MGRRVGHAPAIAHDQTWGEWYNKHSRLLNPFAAGAAVGLAGVLDALLVPFWWQTVAGVSVAGLGVFLWTIGLLDAMQRRVYRFILVLGMLWMFVCHTPWAAEYKLDFGIGWFCAVMLAGCAYWTDQRETKRREVDAEVKAWAQFKAKKLGIELSRITPKRKTKNGSTRRLWWDGDDYTVSQIKGLAPRIEASLGIPLGQLRVMEVKNDNDMTRSDCVDLVENTDNAARRIPVAFTSPTMTSICDAMDVGPYDDGEMCQIYWYKQGFGGTHTLAAGATRSGKSGLYHLMLAETANCDDVVRFGIDAKGGMALRPWAPMFHWLVCGRDEAAKEEASALLERINAIMIYRENYAASKGWDVWRVSKKHPLIILYVDEAAEVFNMQMENFHPLQLVEKLGRMGAGVGVLLCAATQYPTLDAIGSSQLQANILRRFCFRVQQTAHQAIALGRHNGAVDATFPDKPGGDQGAGWCFLSEMGYMRDMALRVRNVDRDGIYDIVCKYWTRCCPLDAGSANVDCRNEEYAARKIWRPEDVKPSSGVWTDEDDDTPDPALGPDAIDVELAAMLGDSGGDSKGSPAGNPAGESAGNEPGTPAGNDTKEQVMDPTAVMDSIPIELMLVPQGKAEAEDLAAAQKRYAEENEDWSTERATAEFWKIFQLAGRDGVRVKTLREKCHRSVSWTQNKRREAQEAQAIVPIAAGSEYYRLVSPSVVPKEYRLDSGNAQ